MCNRSFAKVFLIVCNVVFLLGGGVLLAIGIIIKVDPRTLAKYATFFPTVAQVIDIVANVEDMVRERASDDLTRLIENSAWVLIAIGGVIFILGLLGVFGALKEERITLLVYAILVSIILAAEVIGGIYAYVKRDDIKADIKDVLAGSIQKDYVGMYINVTGSDVVLPGDAVSLAWDLLQTLMKCCGADSQAEYQTAVKFKAAYTDDPVDPVIPVSCCKVVTVDVFPSKLGELSDPDTIQEIVECMTQPTIDNSHVQGCYGIILDKMGEYFNTVLGVMAAILVVEIAGIVCACVLRRKNNQTGVIS